MASSGRRSLLEEAKEAEIPKGKFPTAEEFRAAGRAALSDQARNDEALREDATRAIDQLRALNSLDSDKVETDLSSLTNELSKLSIDNFAERERVYNRVMADYPCSVGKAVSKKERDETGKHHSTLVYGEITFDSFALVFDKIKATYGQPCPINGLPGVMQEPGGIFYDIGSGTGKPVFAAVALHAFKKAVGIEILEGLFHTSQEIAIKWEAEAKPALRGLNSGVDTEVEFLCGDFTDISTGRDWTDGDVLFANSTCFDDKLMGTLANLAAGLKKGAIFITLTKRLPSPHFKVLESEMYTMSWGGATVYVQQKVDDPQA